MKMKLDLGDAFLIIGVLCLSIGLGLYSVKLMLIVIGLISLLLWAIDFFGLFKRGNG